LKGHDFSLAAMDYTKSDGISRSANTI
jgi:hypothetical protein